MALTRMYMPHMRSVVSCFLRLLGDCYLCLRHSPEEESGLVPRLKLWVDSSVSPSSSSTTGTEIGEFEYLASSPSEAPETSEVHSVLEDISSNKTSSAPVFMASTTKYTSKSNPLYALQKQYALSKKAHDGDEVASVSSSAFLDGDDDAIELSTKPDVLTDSLSSKWVPQ